ncbi:MAG: class I SAM-dependent methyltransferase [Verrucomicrobiota bacterium]|jgi:SAM-dependent methyltransferase
MSNPLEAKATPGPGSSDPPRGKWPKVLPPLSPEQKRINDDFMAYWHEVLPREYHVADRFNHQYVRRCPSPGFRRTLEVGAGLGEHLLYERLTPEQERGYVALDFRETMIERLKARFPRIRACVGDCQTQLDFPDNFFDRILAINVLEHLPDLPRAVEELHRLCDKHSGFLSVVIPCEGGLAYSLARRISAQRIFERRYKRPYKLFIGREHINLPWEIYGELDRRFTLLERTFFPIPIPLEFCNLFIGLTLRPK